MNETDLGSGLHGIVITANGLEGGADPRREGVAVSTDTIDQKIAGIPDRLESIWQEAESSGQSVNIVADAMARRAIGR